MKAENASADELCVLVDIQLAFSRSTGVGDLALLNHRFNAQIGEAAAQPHYHEDLSFNSGTLAATVEDLAAVGVRRIIDASP
ncbi:MAG: hypothetical protein AAGF78_08130 [Pseudomonadota bacterium]